MRTFLLRTFLGTFGRLSQGVRLCFSDGPTAGTTLSYAYRNEAHGRLLLGKWIDRRFLNYVGWRRARDRLSAVKSVLLETIASMQHDGMQVDLLDLASGPADYVEEISQRSPSTSILCRDASAASVAAGSARVAAGKLNNVRFAQGDALDRASIVSIRPTPTLILSVGLYELLDEVAARTSIEIVAETLPPGGRFILVHQAKHSNLDMAERLFPTARRAPVQLFLRSAGALEGMLRSAGLEPLESKPCAEGWYVVITALKGKNGPGSL